MTEKVRFGSKAGTLRTLAPHLKSARVLPLHSFSVAAWVQDQEKVLDGVFELPWSSSGSLVVRSSAKSEDSSTQSLAGQFTSVLNVRGRQNLVKAISVVIDSYGAFHSENEILVQPELEGVIFSGVACNCEPNSGAPYRVISWYEGTDTTKVTSGNSDGVETWVGVIHREPTALPQPLRTLLYLLDEIEELTGELRFEVEFGVSDQLELILLQARPLVISGPAISRVEHRKTIEGLFGELEQRQQRKQLAGTPIYSSMSDWNPAEMIGEKPRQLAASLYEYLITDQTWAAARASYGYRDMRGFPLMVNIGGLHYIDVLASMNSFTPRAVNEGLVRRLSEYYSTRLTESPQLHDKIEFEVVPTCNSFGLTGQLTGLISAGFSSEDTLELQEALVALTNEVILGESTWRRDRRLIEDSRTLEATNIEDALTRCRDSGAFPFAGLARAGFISRTLLMGLLDEEILSSEDVERLMGSLGTVTHEMIRDLNRLPLEEFLTLYGHLRPGTYDICASSYAEDPDRYFERGAFGDSLNLEKHSFSLSDGQRKAIALLMVEVQMVGTPDELIDFIGCSMRDREWGKFEYSRQISHLLNLLIDHAHQLGFSREEFSYLPIGEVVSSLGKGERGRDSLARMIEEGRTAYGVTSSILLPPIITSSAEVFDFQVPTTTPNYVTKLRVLARVADVDRGDEVEGAIALISSADPGFDWLFTTGIVGLITAYGGVNSHMAIRAQELGIPTATGVGPNRFASYRLAHSIELDCAAGFIRVTR